MRYSFLSNQRWPETEKTRTDSCRNPCIARRCVFRKEDNSPPCLPHAEALHGSALATAPVRPFPPHGLASHTENSSNGSNCQRVPPRLGSTPAGRDCHKQCRWAHSREITQSEYPSGEAWTCISCKGRLKPSK